MIKQIVTEVWNGDNVSIQLGYDNPECLIGKKEREEFILRDGDFEVVMYYIWVPKNRAL
jgi:hypothetical protein